MNLSIDPRIWDEALASFGNISQMVENFLAQELKRKKEEGGEVQD